MVIEPGVVTAGVVGGRMLTFVRRLKSTAPVGTHLFSMCGRQAVFTLVILVTRLRVGRTRNRGFISGRGTRLFFCTLLLNQV